MSHKALTIYAVVITGVAAYLTYMHMQTKKALDGKGMKVENGALVQK